MMNYTNTLLEQQVEDELKALNITKPLQLLDIEWIATKYEVYLSDHNNVSVSGVYEDMSFIFLDNRLGYFEQREHFFHELGHIILHLGDQQHLPYTYTSLQEARAKKFALYFSVPTFMLKQTQLSQYRCESIDIISKTFHVGHDFAMERLSKYEAQLQVEQYYHYTSQRTESKRLTVAETNGKRYLY